MSERDSINKALRLGRACVGQDVKLPIDRRNLPPSRIQRAQELIAMARAARRMGGGAS